MGSVSGSGMGMTIGQAQISQDRPSATPPLLRRPERGLYTLAPLLATTPLSRSAPIAAPAASNKTIWGATDVGMENASSPFRSSSSSGASGLTQLRKIAPALQIDLRDWPSAELLLAEERKNSVAAAGDEAGSRMEVMDDLVDYEGGSGSS